jgi:hypothetical protein
MNKILSLFFVIVVSKSLHSQDAKVYFMRSEGFQAPAAPFNIFIDHKMVGKLGNKRYSTHTITPGKHTFSTQFGGQKSNDKAEKIELQTDPGKTYYIQLNFKHGIFKNKLHFKEVKEEDAKKVLPNLRQVKG